MTESRKVVVLGVLGTQLDSGKGPSRWERWRPTVALCQQDDLRVDELVMLHAPKDTALARRLAEDIGHVSPETTVTFVPFAVRDAWDFEEVYESLHEVARARAFDPAREDLLVHITTGTHVVQICLFLLTEARYLPGRLLQTSPRQRQDHVRGERREPDEESDGTRGSYGVVDLDLGKYDRLASRVRAEREDDESLLKDGIVTKNEAYNTLVARVETVAKRSKAPMLLLGPTGAGKSALARRVYALKKARQGLEGPFVEVNCATLRGDAAMSALFGHEKGAFTGAVGSRRGHLARAHRGVLFLDEVFELGLDEQAMLLRAIEDKVFTPMGSDREVSSEFQLICGTNRDLFEAAASGTFRDDLLARIDLWTFTLPSLRERLEDLEPNLDHETERVGRGLGLSLTWAREARDEYLRFSTSPEASWPGNFRDLNASVTRLGTLAEGGRITRALVREEITRLRALFAGAGKPPVAGRRGRGGEGGPSSLVERLVPDPHLLDRFDRVQLEEVLAVCASTRSLGEAGRVLFAESRKKKGSVNDSDRLRKYLARFGLEHRDVHEASRDA